MDLEEVGEYIEQYRHTVAVVRRHHLGGIQDQILTFLTARYLSGEHDFISVERIIEAIDPISYARGENWNLKEKNAHERIKRDVHCLREGLEPFFEQTPYRVTVKGSHDGYRLIVKDAPSPRKKGRGRRDRRKR